jgi:hypothetical protein
MTDTPQTAAVRKEERLALMMPVKVRTHAIDGSVCEEEALMQDVSSRGMAFRARMALRKGQVVHLSAPVPKTLRQFGQDSAAYQVYGIVRNLLVDDDGCRVGVMFFGKDPPRGYERNPAARFLLPSDVRPDREPAARKKQAEPLPPADPGGKRRHERYDVVVELELFYIDEWGTVLDQERTVAENVSLGGARVMTTHSFAVGDVVLLREVGGSFEARAQIVGSYVGPNLVRRLNLKFLDGRGPMHLMNGGTRPGGAGGSA